MFKPICLIYIKLLLAVLTCFPDFSFSQDDTTDIDLIDTLIAAENLFASEKPLKFMLISDFKKLQAEKAKPKYQPAKLIYFQGDTNEIIRDVKIKARGKNRLENCYFPPLKIAFKTKDSSQNSGANALKMVLKCRDLPRYQNYLIKEFLCYKLYQVLTDTAFRVRLVDFTYVDAGKKKNKTMNMYAFLIEDDNMLAQRLNMTLAENEKLTQRNIFQFPMMRLAIFQYMIGNYDWAVPIRQNLKILESMEFKRRYYIAPYDFDYCGLVGAEYAVPVEKLGIRDVSERIYLGECKPEELFIPLIKLFDEKKQAFFNTINSFDYLDSSEKKNMIAYLDEFYSIIHKADFYADYIKKSCKEIK